MASFGSSSSSSSSFSSSVATTTSPRGSACLCSPSTHPGSFRCRLHRERRRVPARPASPGHRWSGSAERAEPRAGGSARGAEAKSMRAVLMQIIRPSSHDLCRRRDFQRRPTRFGPVTSGQSSVAVI